MTQVGENFRSALRTALMIDGEDHDITFAALPDPTKDKVTVTVNMLLIERERGEAPRDLAYIASRNSMTLVFFKEEVPGHAVVNANTFLKLDGIQYKVLSSDSKYDIFTVELSTVTTGAR